MAGDGKKKGARKGTGRARARATSELALRLRTDPRSERRFEPQNSPMAMVSIAALAIGAALVGAGTFGQWFRDTFRDTSLGPHRAAPYLLAAGAIVLLGALLFGESSPRPIRVGDAGIGFEKGPNDVERIGWKDIKKFLLNEKSLTIQASGTSMTLALNAHKLAAGRVIAEARKRIPERVKDIAEGELEKVDETAGTSVQLDAAQVAGQHCRSSNKLISFEADARLCGRCGEVYHKDSVPKHCLSCDAQLKA